METVTTRVCIIGGGPSGLMLSQLLHRRGIDNVLLEKHTREHVLGRIRAGVLEHGFTELMREAGCGRRMDEEGEVHEAFRIADADADTVHRIDLAALTGGRTVTVYGQTELTKDLYQARDEMGGTVIHEVDDVVLHDLTSTRPSVTYSVGGRDVRVGCHHVIGADGFHGVSRPTIPDDDLSEFERTYPFGWLGVLSETRPVTPEVMYVRHPRGFALCSLRSQVLSRYYIQVPLTDRVEDWPDDAFWTELQRRLPEEMAAALETGPSIEKSIAPLRSYVAEPLRHGRLLLAGDAAHIFPPTGARGLNSAASDIHYLYRALVDHYHNGDDRGLDDYSERALARVWKAQRFSWWMTGILHTFPEATAYDRRIQDHEMAYVFSSRAALTSMAENYVGLPY